MNRILQFGLVIALIGFCTQGHGGWAITSLTATPYAYKWDDIGVFTSGTGSPGYPYYVHARILNRLSVHNYSPLETGNYNTGMPQAAVTPYLVISPSYSANTDHKVGASSVYLDELVDDTFVYRDSEACVITD